MQGDGRADWCGINDDHGPHGAKAKGGACPGLTGRRASSNGERLKPTVTKKVVESSVNWLNGKLKELGSERRYQFEMGHNGHGVRHKLLEYVPDLDHPRSQEVIGRTLAEALKYVNAMNHALSGVVADRRRARDHIIRGE